MSKLISDETIDGIHQRTWRLEKGDMPDLDREMAHLRRMRKLCIFIRHKWGIGHVNSSCGPLPFWGQCQRCWYVVKDAMDAAFDLMDGAGEVSARDGGYFAVLGGRIIAQGATPEEFLEALKRVVETPAPA